MPFYPDDVKPITEQDNNDIDENKNDFPRQGEYILKKTLQISILGEKWDVFLQSTLLVTLNTKFSQITPPHIGKFEFKKCIFFIPAVIACPDLRDLFSDLK